MQYTKGYSEEQDMGISLGDGVEAQRNMLSAQLYKKWQSMFDNKHFYGFVWRGSASSLISVTWGRTRQQRFSEKPRNFGARKSHRQETSKCK